MIILHWDQNSCAENSLEFKSLFVLKSPYRFACVCVYIFYTNKNCKRREYTIYR